MPVVSISIDDELLDKFDEVREKFQHRSRSEAIRDAINFYIEDREKLDSMEGTGLFVLTAVFRGKHEVSDRVSDLIDGAGEVVKSTLQYKEHGTNVLVVVAGGEVGDVRNFYASLSSTKDVTYCHFQRLK
ncbi:MAG: CopG family ribbon-helix-helix protein [Promethearchaeota archaeon]